MDFPSAEDPARAARRLRARADLLDRLDHAAQWLRRAPKPPPPPLLRALDTAARWALARIPAPGTGCGDCPRREKSACSCGVGCDGQGCGGTRPCGELRGRAEAFGRAWHVVARGGAGSDGWADLWSTLERLREGLGADVRERRTARDEAR